MGVVHFFGRRNFRMYKFSKSRIVHMSNFTSDQNFERPIFRKIEKSSIMCRDDFLMSIQYLFHYDTYIIDEQFVHLVLLIKI